MKFSIVIVNQLLIELLILLLVLDLSNQSEPIKSYPNLKQPLSLPEREKIKFDNFEEKKLYMKTIIGNTEKPKKNKNSVIDFDLTKIDLKNVTQIVSFYNDYTKHFNKKYETKHEVEERMNIFKETIVSINEHNSDDCSHYTQGINELSDMTWPEIVKQKFGLNKENVTKKIKVPQITLYSATETPATKIPVEWDWRKYGIVTPPKKQLTCGSCWSFSSVSVLETYLMKIQISEGKFDPKNQLTLSEQNLLDCSASFGTKGCDGGSTRMAFNYLKESKGLNTDKEYPYINKVSSSCQLNKEKLVNIEVKESQSIDSEDELVSTIYNHGPVTVSIHATKKKFYNYKSGIFEDPLCNPQGVNHYMTAVGYTADYFILKNSWGQDWGEDGYIRVSRAKVAENCGLYFQSYYPVMTNAVETDKIKDKLKKI
ncbi:crustapain-like [Oppia nitens]|uniref:crustapain-like n=1 Tax=Oppia nitens TaxID=1686743 RepID=UPI0023DA50C4|nr:crustapain-like [Oppia nitens]